MTEQSPVLLKLFLPSEVMKHPELITCANEQKASAIMYPTHAIN